MQDLKLKQPSHYRAMRAQEKVHTMVDESSKQSDLGVSGACRECESGFIGTLSSSLSGSVVTTSAGCVADSLQAVAYRFTHLQQSCYFV